MRKKIILLIISVVITLFFLAVSIYQFWQVYIGPLWENSEPNNNTLIAGWAALLLALLALCSLLVICRSDPTHL